MDIDIKKECKAPCGVYILFGEEDYLKRFYRRKIKEAVLGDGSFDFFNHVSFSQKDFSADSAMTALMTPPVGFEKKLIELCEFAVGDMKKDELEALVGFFEEAEKYGDAVVLMSLADGAFDYGSAKGGRITKPSALYKKLSAKAKTAYFPKAGMRELTVWAYKHFQKDGISVSEGNLNLLVNMCDGDMMTLSGEIEKLCIYIKAAGRTELCRDDIDRVTCETRELEPFGISTAIMNGKTDEALSILNLMEQKRIRPFTAFASIYSTYIDLYKVRACLDMGLGYSDTAARLKMHEYRAKLYAGAARAMSLSKISAVLDLCREADIKIKGETADYGRLYALVCEAALL